MGAAKEWLSNLVYREGWPRTVLACGKSAAHIRSERQGMLAQFTKPSLLRLPRQTITGKPCSFPATVNGRHVAISRDSGLVALSLTGQRHDPLYWR
jgi:hypothetical protein